MFIVLATTLTLNYLLNPVIGFINELNGNIITKEQISEIQNTLSKLQGEENNNIFRFEKPSSTKGYYKSLYFTTRPTNNTNNLLAEKLAAVGVYMTQQVFKTQVFNLLSYDLYDNKLC